MLGLDRRDKLKKLPGKCFISIYFMSTLQLPTRNAQYEIIPSDLYEVMIINTTHA